MKTIPLTRGQVALVDDDDFERLSKHRWCYLSGDAGAGYAYRHIREDGKQKTILMHRAIMNPTKGFEIDHIDHDGLNNSKSNMREVTHAQNMMNLRANAGGTSAYKGVCFPTDSRNFVAQIQVNHKTIYLGCFTDERLAAQAYNNAAVKYYGAYACLNAILG